MCGEYSFAESAWQPAAQSSSLYFAPSKTSPSYEATPHLDNLRSKMVRKVYKRDEPGTIQIEISRIFPFKKLTEWISIEIEKTAKF